MSTSLSEWADGPATGREERDHETLDEYVRAFEHAHNNAGSAVLADFLPPSNHRLYGTVLRELVRVDLEFGWERGSAKSLDQYQHDFPELKDDRESLREIAFEEYRLRKQAGQSPSAREYLDRFGLTIEPPSGRVFALGSSQFRSNLSGIGSLFTTEFGGRSTTISSLPEVGSKFLDFRLVGLLGKGSFGRVYLARQDDLAQRTMVLKVTSDQHDESQTLAQLQHDHIVPVYSSHKVGNLRAVCMPYLGSVTLRDLYEDLKTRGTLPGSGRELVSSLNKSSVRKRVGASPSTLTNSTPSEPTADPGRSSENLAQAAVVPPKRQGVETLGMLGALSYVGAVVWMGSKIADGLAHAHERGILHRDIKPANILLTDDGRPMLLDFNLAADMKRTSLDTGTDRDDPPLGGTLAYMSPEHLEAFQGKIRLVDARSDIYSFGIILYEMLTGRPPFPIHEGEREAILAAMILDRQGPPPRLRALNRSVSPAVESVIQRCLDPDPARRYPTARALGEDLGRHLAHLPLKHTPNPSLTERVLKLAKRNSRVVVGLAVLGLASMVGLTYAAVDQSRKHEANLALQSVDRFHEHSRRSQSLLNSWMQGNAKRHQGMDAAREALDQVHALDQTEWWTMAPATLLPRDSHFQLRREVGELIVMLARAEIEDAAESTDPDVRRANYRSALRDNERAEACFPAHYVPAPVYWQRADIFRALDEPKQADGMTERARAQPMLGAPDDVMMGMDLFHRQKYAEALSYFVTAYTKDSQKFEAWLGAGLCHEKLADPANATACYDRCAVLRPDDPAPLFNRALLTLRRDDKLNEAKRDFERVHQLVPNDPEPVANLAIIARRQGRNEDAITGLTRALAMGSTMTRLYFARADARRDVGDLKGEALDRATGLNLTPTDVSSWVARAMARSERREYDKALDDIAAALKLDPNSYSALLLKTSVLAEKLKKTEEAIVVFDQIVKLNPKLAPSLAGRAVLLARLGRMEEAKRDIEEALRLELQGPIYYKAACVHALTSRQGPGDRREAVDLLEIALRKGHGSKLIEDDPDLDPIRDDPMFQSLENKVKQGLIQVSPK